MKTASLLASFLAFASMAHAQWDNPTGVNTTPGNIGIGTAPADRLHVATNITNRGLTVAQTGTIGGCRLLLNNQTAGGRGWALYSLGNGNLQGAGHFLIYDETNAINRLFIQGATGNVGIGTIAPTYKLHVTGSNNCVRGEAFGGAGAVGVGGTAAGSVNNRGGLFQATAAAGVTSYGVLTEIITPNAGGTNYALYASVGGNPNAGAGPNYAGYFNGDVVTTSAAYYFSDRRMKKDIAGMTNSLDLINKLRPVTYHFKREENAGIYLPAEKQYGFISQEVQELIPEFTKTVIHPASMDENGKETAPAKEVLGLNYNGFIALLTKGMQEQQQQLEKQQKLIDMLMQELSRTSGIPALAPVEPGFRMLQNEPNPFTHETVVEYTLPQSVSSAYMVVYDLAGKQITTFTLDQKGPSSLTVTSEKLAAGMYIYSIVADGKLVDSKRMIVAGK